ncbi:MAG: MerR family transcriptional regulator [Anaerolineae bacterium]
MADESIQGHQKLFSIGQVVELLKTNCPHVSVSMLRYWEKEGLIEPRRTEGGHRQFCPGDVERLRTIVELRSQRHLPLSAVKSILQRIQEDVAYDITLHEQISRPVHGDPGFQPLTRQQAAQRTALSVGQIETLERLGLLLPCTENGELRYDEDDINIMELIAGLMAIGFAPDDLSFYADLAEAQIEREHGLFEHICGSEVGGHGKADLYKRFRQLVGPLQHLLYLKYLRRKLSQVLAGQQEGAR